MQKLKLPHVEKNYNTPTSRERVLKLLGQRDHPFKTAWKYMQLDKEIRSDKFVDRVKFFNDLLIQPFFTIIFWVGMFIFPDLLEWFGMDLTFSWFNMTMWIISAFQTILKCLQRMISLIEYYELSSTLFQWKVITHANSGPFITGPSEYSPLIYADAIERITASLRE